MKAFFGIETNKYIFEWSDITTALTILNVMLVLAGFTQAPWVGIINCLLGLALNIKFRTHINMYIMQIALIVLNFYFLTLQGLTNSHLYVKINISNERKKEVIKMKMYVAQGWESTEVRLYTQKENAIEDFKEMIEVAKADPGLFLMSVDVEYDKEDRNYIFLMATAMNLEKLEPMFASVELIEVEDALQKSRGKVTQTLPLIFV